MVIAIYLILKCWMEETLVAAVNFKSMVKLRVNLVVDESLFLLQFDLMKSKTSYIPRKNVRWIFYSAAKRINLLLATPANKLSRLKHKVGNFARNSLHFKMFPEIFHAANFNGFSIMSGYFCATGFCRRLLLCRNNSGCPWTYEAVEYTMVGSVKLE